MDNKEALLTDIKTGKVTLGILGLGYVGLPLAVTFARNGIRVIGFDKSTDSVNKVNRGENYIADVEDRDLKQVLEEGTLSATLDFAEIGECNALLICVPTPLDRFKKPDMTYIEASCNDIGTYMKKGTFICLESTTYPTTTELFMRPILENKSGLKEGQDFWLAYSPERVDPGNKDFKTENIPKVIGALGEDGLELGLSLYSKAIKEMHPVSSPRIAEMVKILENTYRLVNISLINELALLCNRMDIDIWEAIEAAKTKPYGFQAFYPGPGIGGHCIPLDPFYLEYIAKNYNFDLTMINTAGNINNLMPHRMLVKISFALNKQRKAINGSRILFLGIAYKPNIADERESPALKIIEEVIHKGGLVSYHDPFISETKLENGEKLCSEPLTEESLAEADCVVVTTSHDSFDYERIVKHAGLVVDLRNAIDFESDKVYKL